MFEKLYHLIETAPTTKLRILSTLGLALVTAMKYWISVGWIPAAEWLIFLTGMAGLDVLQHNNKRKTTFSPTEIAKAAQIQNGYDPHSDEEEIG